MSIKNGRTPTWHPIFRSALVLCLTLAVQSCSWMELVSSNSTGTAARARSDGEAGLSSDGRYIAFISLGNLTGDDLNGSPDIYVRDTFLGITTRITDSPNADPFSNYYFYQDLSMSGDGRYIAFVSDASNLVEYDGNNSDDVFLHDRTLGTTRLIGRAPGDVFLFMAAEPALSADGKYLAFYSTYDTIVPGDPIAGGGIFLLNLDTETYSRGTAGGGYRAAVSSDAQYVAFSSSANDLVPNDTNNKRDIFIYDRDTATTTRVSVDSAGMEADGASHYASLSADARYVAFFSSATNLVAGDTNGDPDIFIHDRTSGSTELVSVDSQGNIGNNWSYPSPNQVSGDGRYVVFESFADNLVPDDTNGTFDVFLRDTLLGTTRRISVSQFGGQGDRHSIEPSISRDGRYIAFETYEKSLIPGSDWPSNIMMPGQLVIRAAQQPTVTSIIPNMLPIGATTAVTITGSYFIAGADVITKPEVDNIVVVNEHTITAEITVPGSTDSGAINVVVSIPGTGPGTNTGSAALCKACITLF